MAFGSLLNLQIPTKFHTQSEILPLSVDSEVLHPEVQVNFHLWLQAYLSSLSSCMALRMEIKSLNAPEEIVDGWNGHSDCCSLPFSAQSQIDQSTNLQLLQFWGYQKSVLSKGSSH